MLTEDCPDLKTKLSGKYPSPMYYSEDIMAFVDFVPLDDLCQTIEEILLNFASSNTTGELKFSREAINCPIFIGEGNFQLTF